MQKEDHNPYRRPLHHEKTRAKEELMHSNTQHPKASATDTEPTVEIGELIVEGRTPTVAVAVTRCGQVLLLLLLL